MPRDVVRVWCPMSFVSHTSETDHLSTCTLGDVDETESEWNTWKEDHKWLTYLEISWINVTTPPYTFSHCFLPHSFSKCVKKPNLLQNTVCIQILRNCFMQQNRKDHQKGPPKSCPTEALPWHCKPACSVAYDTSTMLLQITGHGNEEPKLGQLLPFQGPATSTIQLQKM